MTKPDATIPGDPGEPVACTRVRARLAELLDGGLSPLDAARDEGHLEACAACAAEREAWRALIGVVHAVEAEGAALGLDAALVGLEERLARREPPHARTASKPPVALRAVWSRVALPLAAAAAAVAALLALQQGGIELEGPSHELRSAILPDVRPSIPSWGGLLEGEGAGRSTR